MLYRLLARRKRYQNPYLNRVELIGHSYGGLLVTDFLKSWDIEVPLQIHSIAAPLKGLGASLESFIRGNDLQGPPQETLSLCRKPGTDA